MGIGTSLVLAAVGAILKWGVSDSVSGVSLATIGTILLIVGIVGLMISLLFMTAWAGRRDDVVVRERRVVERDPLG